MRPTPSAIVPARNAAGTLAAAVESILTQIPAVDEVVIAVAPSSDGTEQVAHDCASRDGRVTVVANSNGSIPSGLNRAIEATTGDIIVRVDAHSVLPAGYVDRVLSALQDVEVANAGGIQHAVGHTPMERAVAAALMNRFGAGGAAFHVAEGEIRPVDTVFLGAFRRSALDVVGRFDETLLTNEDYELNWRLRQAGFTVLLDPSLRVDYRPRGSFRSLASQFWRYGWWKQKMVQKHPTSIRARQLAAPVLVVAFGASAVAAVARPVLGLVVPSVYGLACSLAAASAPGVSMDERARLVLIFPTMHGAWGAGFLASLVTRAKR